MTKLYKITDEVNTTYNDTQWGPGIEHCTSGRGPLCSEAWLHAYTDKYIAILVHPFHTSFVRPRLWEATGKVGAKDTFKVGCSRLKTVRRIPLPKPPLDVYRRFVILFAKATASDNKAWLRWANKWLSGKDRSKKAADAAFEKVRTSDPHAMYHALCMALNRDREGVMSTFTSAIANLSSLNRKSCLSEAKIREIARQAFEE